MSLKKFKCSALRPNSSSDLPVFNCLIQDTIFLVLWAQTSPNVSVHGLTQYAIHYAASTHRRTRYHLWYSQIFIVIFQSHPLGSLV